MHEHPGVPFILLYCSHMHGTVVGVLRGGPSREHEVSLKTGHAILSNLPRDRFTVRDIYIDREGVWHDKGVRTTPGNILRSIDVAIIGIHGAYGQDGQVQKLLDLHGIPYTGADPWGAFHASHKVMAKVKAEELGVKTPKFRFIERDADPEPVLHEVIRSFHQPVVIKPVDSGSSVGVAIVSGYAPAYQAVQALFEEGTSGVLVEELIRGTEATVGVVEGLRGEDLYALPPVEIRPPSSVGFFSYEAKYSGESEEICPGRFSKAETEELRSLARKMHEGLGQRHYSRSDFIVTPRGIYYLETNTAAAVGMTEQSLFPKGLAAVGVKFSDFLTHLVDLAVSAKRR